jgi:hypothetical protein
MGVSWLAELRGSVAPPLFQSSKLFHGRLADLYVRLEFRNPLVGGIRPTVKRRTRLFRPKVDLTAFQLAELSTPALQLLLQVPNLSFMRSILRFK